MSRGQTGQRREGGGGGEELKETIMYLYASDAACDSTKNWTYTSSGSLLRGKSGKNERVPNPEKLRRKWIEGRHC